MLLVMTPWVPAGIVIPCPHMLLTPPLQKSIPVARHWAQSPAYGWDQERLNNGCSETDLQATDMSVYRWNKWMCMNHGAHFNSLQPSQAASMNCCHPYWQGRRTQGLACPSACKSSMDMIGECNTVLYWNSVQGWFNCRCGGKYLGRCHMHPRIE